MNDLIKRQAAIYALTNFITPHDNGDGTMTIGVLSKSSITDILNDLPSEQPEPLDEWCTDCKEYDHERHCCPRFNRVIRQTLKDAQLDQWIPCSERLPEELGDYLVSIKRDGWNCEEYVENDIAYWDDIEGFHKTDKVIAWMPLPEPYKTDRKVKEDE